MKKTAVILAGGKGKRLKPYTLTMPKPLMPLEDKPILEIIIRNLSKYGFKKIYIAANYRSDIIKAFFENGKKFGVEIIYSVEKKELGTAAPIKILKKLPSNFLVINGDILTNLNFNTFYNEHVKKKSLMSIGITQRKQLIDYGIIEIDKKKIINIKEKPIYNFYVSMGIYVLNKRILKFIPKNKRYGFNNLIEKILHSKIRIDYHLHNGYWLDIGRPDDYERAQLDYKKIKKL